MYPQKHPSIRIGHLRFKPTTFHLDSAAALDCDRQAGCVSSTRLPSVELICKECINRNGSCFGAAKANILQWIFLGKLKCSLIVSSEQEEMIESHYDSIQIGCPTVMEMRIAGTKGTDLLPC